MPALFYRDPADGTYKPLTMASADHGVLTGLGDDDHPQYVKEAGVKANLVPATGWADYGSPYTGLWATRSGALITVEGFLKRTSDLAISAGGTYPFMTLPDSSWWPPHRVSAPCAYQTAAQNYGTAGRLMIEDDTGTMRLVAFTSSTINTGHWLSFNVTYRAP